MLTVLISGANRGLGLEFARQYLEEGWRVIALCRDAEKATELAVLNESHGKLDIYEADVTDFDRIRELADRMVDQSIDVLINNAGVFGPKPTAEGDKRQSFGYFDADILAEVFRVNSVAPLILTEAFLDQILASEHKKVITISSVLGSIEEAQGGLYAYRMSKAAVNMAMANLAKEITSNGVIVTTVSPGWVKTDMGGEDAAITVADSISKVRAIISGLTPAESGSFIDFDGRIIPW
jgi:NAD(P)-dependent dehydrogenase (short-subunit alcohol dehydrogenase family)